MILTACHWWIVGLWLAFVIYWAVAAMFVKRGGGRIMSRNGLYIRLALAAAIVIVLKLTHRSPELRILHAAGQTNAGMAVAGALIATVGAVLAFAARATIGRNWGTPATRRPDTQLVTTGPYRLVRHPIYSGMLLMLSGTAIGLIPIWWFVAVAAGIYFFFSARAEEKFMIERFPDAYPEYRARTKMLVPFLL